MSDPAAYQLSTDTSSCTLKVAGAMTFDTAPHLYPEAEKILQTQTIERLDLHAVERADSAGLACVLALKAQHHARERTLEVLGAPEGLRSLAQVSGTLTWLPKTAESA